MNFVQIEFLWFFAATLAIYWGLRDRWWQNVYLIAASAFFYGFVHPWFLILISIAAGIDYLTAIRIETDPKNKAYWLLVSLVSNLGMLAFFKYFNFFIDNVALTIESMGLQANLPTLQVLLPVGISFYTFQTMSYTIDVYRGDLRARRSPVDYALYVMFFPQLVAGPIERAQNLLVQVERHRTFDRNTFWDGVGLAMWGGVKKMVVADTIAPYVDKVFILSEPSAPLIWAGAFGFMIQIFADFSGYTDIARGTAKMMGFELAHNFRSPYLAVSTPDFWQRWHISLSFWIRDYLMVPLLGSAGHLTLFRFIWATLLTFTIIGFWHGASWNFILFGFFHGVWMTIYTLVNRNLPDRVAAMTWARPFAIAFHLLAVSLPGSLLFRETSLTRIVNDFRITFTAPFTATADEWIAATTVVGIVVLASLPLMFSWLVEQHIIPRLRTTIWWWPAQTTAWTAMMVAMFLFYRSSGLDFVYFQF